MEYNLKEHGDPLEKSYEEFICTYFKTYESIWKIFVGNKGNNIKADIVGFSEEKDAKRQQFWEHTYTVMQSVILLTRLINKGIFSNKISNTIEDILDLQDNLLLFFTHLGRINDNIKIQN